MDIAGIITLPSAIILLEGIACFIVGFLVFARNISSSVTFSFFFLAFTISSWSIMLGVFESSIGGGNLSRMTLLALYLLATLIPLSLILFSLVLSFGAVSVSRAQFPLLFIPTILSVAVVFSPGFAVPLESFDGWAKEIAFSKLIFAFAIYCVIYTIASLLILAKTYILSAGVFRSELKLIFIAVAAAATGMVFANIFLPFLGYYNFSWIGPTVGVVALGFIGYAIIKYRFGMIKLAVIEYISAVISFVLIFDLFLSQSTTNLVAKAIVLLLVIYLTVLLVRSVRKEYKRKNRAESLAAKLIATNKKLRDLDRQKSEFVSTAAHQLRDPLTAIKGYASLILEGSFGEINKKAQDAVSRILESSNRLFAIIDDFMNISRIESGEMNYEFLEVDMEEVVHEIVEDMALHAQNKGLDIHLNIQKGGGGRFMVCADEGKIRQVISNIIDNAIKYTTAGHINIALYRDSDRVVVKVSDSGIGMSAQTLKKIFHKFSRAEEASKFHTDGSGLGLYVAKEILKKHEGCIWAESEGIGKGSTFFIELKAS